MKKKNINANFVFALTSQYETKPYWGIQVVGEDGGKTTLTPFTSCTINGTNIQYCSDPSSSSNCETTYLHGGSGSNFYCITSTGEGVDKKIHTYTKILPMSTYMCNSKEKTTPNNPDYILVSGEEYICNQDKPPEESIGYFYKIPSGSAEGSWTEGNWTAIGNRIVESAGESLWKDVHENLKEYTGDIYPSDVNNAFPCYKGTYSHAWSWAENTPGGAKLAPETTVNDPVSGSVVPKFTEAGDCSEAWKNDYFKNHCGTCGSQYPTSYEAGQTFKNQKVCMRHGTDGNIKYGCAEPAVAMEPGTCTASCDGRGGRDGPGHCVNTGKANTSTGGRAKIVHQCGQSVVENDQTTYPYSHYFFPKLTPHNEPVNPATQQKGYYLQRFDCECKTLGELNKDIDGHSARQHIIDYKNYTGKYPDFFNLMGYPTDGEQSPTTYPNTNRRGLDYLADGEDSLKEIWPLPVDINNKNACQRAVLGNYAVSYKEHLVDPTKASMRKNVPGYKNSDSLCNWGKDKTEDEPWVVNCAVSDGQNYSYAGETEDKQGQPYNAFSCIRDCPPGRSCYFHPEPYNSKAKFDWNNWCNPDGYEQCGDNQWKESGAPFNDKGWATTGTCSLNCPSYSKPNATERACTVDNGISSCQQLVFQKKPTVT